MAYGKHAPVFESIPAVTGVRLHAERVRCTCTWRGEWAEGVGAAGASFVDYLRHRDQKS